MAVKNWQQEGFSRRSPGTSTTANRGVLFVNDKGDNDARPDMTGNLAIKPDDYQSRR
jgi:hypothetical protein